jgi:hypothetical protein
MILSSLDRVLIDDAFKVQTANVWLFNFVLVAVEPFVLLFLPRLGEVCREKVKAQK